MGKPFWPEVRKARKYMHMMVDACARARMKVNCAYDVVHGGGPPARGSANRLLAIRSGWFDSSSEERVNVCALYF